MFKKRLDTLKKVLRYMKRYIPILVVSLLFSIVTVAMTLYFPILTGDAIDVIVEKGKVSFGHAKILASITDYAAQVILAKKIAKDKLIVLCRMQVLEGEGRYEKIFITDPPTHIYQYVDRIQCWKNGKKPTGSSAQGYCWLVWDRKNPTPAPVLHWLRRSDKQS